MQWVFPSSLSCFTPFSGRKFALWFRQSTTTLSTSSGSTSIKRSLLGQSRGDSNLVSIQDNHLTWRRRRCISTVPQITQTLTALAHHVIDRQYPHHVRVVVVAYWYTAAKFTPMEVSAKLVVSNFCIPTCRYTWTQTIAYKSESFLMIIVPLTPSAGTLP